MPHVDDGRLSECLDRPIDGSSDRVEIEAHLVECAECRDRLEELRSLKERADTLLRRAAPADVAMPGFDEIEARARARRGAAPRRVLTLHRLRALGWAASIVLAVGIGWIARGVVTREAGNAPVRLDGAPSVAIGGVAMPAESAAASREAAEQQAVTRSPERGGEAAKGVTDLAAAPPAAEPRRQSNEAVMPPAVAEAMPARDAVAAAAPSAQISIQAKAGAEITPDTVARLLQEMAPAPALARPARTRGVVAAEREAGAAAWEPVDSAAAARHLAGALRVVPGLPILRVEVGRVADAPAARVVQQLGGATIEILQVVAPEAVPGAPSMEAPGARDETVAVTTVARDGFLIALRAPVSGDSLAALARKIP